jgi:hypothetical protein
MGRLVKIGFPYHTLAARPARGRTFAESQRAVRPVTRPYVRSDVFQGKPYFLSTVRLFSDS